MELLAQSNVFLNEWLQQINSKVSHIPDDILAEALRFIEEKGIPGIKNEAYRNVPVESILKRYFRKLNTSDTSLPNIEIENGRKFNTIVLSGNQIKTYFLEENIKVFHGKQDIKKEYQDYIGKSFLHQKDFFAALNTAYCDNFTIIHICGSLRYPLHVSHYIPSSLNFSQQRILLIADKKSSFVTFETYQTKHLSQPHFYNCLTEVFTDESVSVYWINFQRDTSNFLYHVNNTSFSLEQQVCLKHHQISLQAGLWRNNIHTHINKSNVNCELKGLSIGKNQSIISQNTAILHHSGHSQSNQLYKNIADDKSTVLFNGFILVDKDAQKTNAYQSSKNLLLNDNATLYAKPQLEIYADDVKCSHGSTTGAMSHDALFYLKTRGIEEATAQKLLLQAFYSDIIESIENIDIKQIVESNIQI